MNNARPATDGRRAPFRARDSEVTMKRPRSILTAVVVCGLMVALAAIVVVFIRAARRLPVFASTATSADPGTGDPPLPAEPPEMKRELAALRRQVASMQGNVALIDERAQADQLRERQAPPDDRTRQQIIDDDERRHREYMAGVAAAFQLEAVDPGWSSGAAASVRQALTGDDLLRRMARDVECRSHTCRVVIEDDGAGKVNGALPDLAMRLGPTLPSVSAQRNDGGGGPATFVLFMSTRPEQAADSR
jgi:hypothetical protein